MSFPENSWMRQCANLVPKEMIITPMGWDMLRKEILHRCKPYIDAELDIAIGRLLFCNKRQKGQIFAQYLTNLKKVRDDAISILVQEEFTCSK